MTNLSAVRGGEGQGVRVAVLNLLFAQGRGWGWQSDIGMGWWVIHTSLPAPRVQYIHTIRVRAWVLCASVFFGEVGGFVFTPLYVRRTENCVRAHTTLSDNANAAVASLNHCSRPSGFAKHAGEEVEGGL